MTTTLQRREFTNVCFESAVNEGITKTLESVKRICEGQGGKEEIEANK